MNDVFLVLINMPFICFISPNMADMNDLNRAGLTSHCRRRRKRSLQPDRWNPALKLLAHLEKEGGRMTLVPLREREKKGTERVSGADARQSGAVFVTNAID